jgi:hypothetical protein
MQAGDRVIKPRVLNVSAMDRSESLVKLKDPFPEKCIQMHKIKHTDVETTPDVHVTVHR